jgi:NAD(P)-dependent dehydrogenase (short-subunit alcohol dehydrogenase family)
MDPAPDSALMLKPGTFAGKTILITGGGSGLGRAMARALMLLGAKLVICGRRQDVLEQTARELHEETGGDCFAIPCDVRDPAQVENLLAQATQACGTLHGLINNAAGNFLCPTERLSYNAFHTVVDIVLRGTANCTLACGKRWISEGTPGTVLSIVTTYAWTGSGYVVPSAVAKAGVLALTRSLASEWGKYGIRTNAIAPGPFPTEGAWSRLMPARVRESAYITGDCITIDGGEWLKNAGEFNFLDALSPAEWDELQSQLKPKKP